MQRRGFPPWRVLIAAVAASTTTRKIVKERPPLKAIMILAVILTGVAGTSVYMASLTVTSPHLQRFSSYENLVLFVQNHRLSPHTFWLFTGYGYVTLQGGVPRGQGGYSQTNVQVEGVDEPDYVKTDGTYLYTVTEDGVAIIRAYPPEEAEIIERFHPEGMATSIFLYNSTWLVVLSRTYGAYDSDSLLEGEGVAIEILNVTDPSAPNRVQWVTLDGNYLGARLIGSRLYLIARDVTTLPDGDVKLPTMHVRDTPLHIPASSIHYDPGDYDYSFDYTIVLTLDVADPEAVPSVEAFLLGSSCGIIYASIDNLYLAVTRWQHDFGINTVIHRLHIAEGLVKYEASGVVPGYLINQFALDEYDGYLRVATTKYILSSNEAGPQRGVQVSNVYVLDMQMRVVGRLEGLAPNERIYAVRFMGHTGYVVTFRKVDPLFVIDLSRPQHPSLVGELWVTGYSDYLHPLGDNYLLGIGKDAIPDPEADWWWYQGVKISIFNATDPCHPVELARLVLGDRGTESPALYDHHAVLIDPALQLLVIPLLLVEHPPNATDLPPWTYGEYVWQGACIFTVDPHNATLVLRGRISHIPDHTPPLDVLNYTSYFVNRALYIGNVLYTVSGCKVAMHDLASLALLGEIDLTASQMGP